MTTGPTEETAGDPQQQRREAIREVLREMGFPVEQVQRIAELLAAEQRDREGFDFVQALRSSGFEEGQIDQIRSAIQEVRPGQTGADAGTGGGGAVGATTGGDPQQVRRAELRDYLRTELGFDIDSVQRIAALFAKEQRDRGDFNFVQALRQAGFDPGQINQIRGAIQDTRPEQQLPYGTQPPGRPPNAAEPRPTIGSQRQTIFDLPENSPLLGRPLNLGEHTIPPGGRLIAITDPDGLDAPKRWVLEYEAFGVRMTFDIGGGARFLDLFPDGVNSGFQSVTRMTQDEYDELSAGYPSLEMGDIEEILDISESIGSQIERGLREAQADANLPDWIRESPQAMLLMFQAGEEQWTSGKTLNELSKTRAFNRRFSAAGLAAIQESLGGGSSLVQAVDTYLASEELIRESLHRYRGPDTRTDHGFVGSLIASGWSPTELDQVLEAENLLRSNPGALRNLNRIRRARQERPLGADEFLKIIRGTASTDTIREVNDALRTTFLQEQGIEIGRNLAAELGVGDTGLDLADPNVLKQSAEIAARNLLRFQAEVTAGKFGIKRADILKAAFGEERSAEVDEKLAKFARERIAAAQGFDSTTSYQDQEGRLRIAGLGGL